MKGFAKGVLKSLITTFIFFAVSEAGLRGVYAIRNAFVQRVPLPYALGDEYGPIPPWLDRLMILQSDDALIWKSTPHVHRTYVDIFSPVRTENDRLALLRRFLPTLPAEFRDNPTWTIDLNAGGDRAPEIATKAPGTIRVACIGDSWTFGMNVDQDKTYPARLAAWLHERQPATRFEVLNFGVLGYSSFQGLQLLKTRVLDLQPDIVAIGFGMNDSEFAGYRDKDMVGPAAPRPIVSKTRLKEFAQDLEVYRLLKYTALLLKFHPKPIGDYLKGERASSEQAAKGSDVVDYDAMEQWVRVSPRDYDANMRQMVDLATAGGARVVLLDNELWDESPYRPILRTISEEKHVPLVDSERLVANAGAKMARDLEARLALAPTGERRPGPSGPGAEAGPKGPALHDTTVVFRVYRGAYPVTSAMSIAGSDPQLGGLVPNSVLMHDDGANGDQRAGDGVWSLMASFAPGTRLSFVYTNSGAPGRWEGLDVPHIRHLTVPSSTDGSPVYLPIDTFGRIYLQADDWHTDATGYDLIGHAVADAIGR